MSHRDPLAKGTYRPFATFSLIWAITTLAHQLAFTFWTETWQGWVLVLAAVAVIRTPDCVLRFGVLALSSMMHLWQKLPFVPNHILYEGMLHLIMLLGIGGFLVSGGGRGEFVRVWGAWKSRLLLVFVAALAKAAYFAIPVIPQGYLLGALTTILLLFAVGRLLFGTPAMAGGESYYGKVAPVLRVAVAIMYAWAGTQKLNWDYFDPSVSCATKLHLEIAAYFGPLVPTGSWTHVLVAVVSLILEFGIPILLFFSRTRYLGFVCAVVFHLWLSIHPAAGIYSFTSLILAILILFVPVNMGVELQRLWDAQLRKVGGGDIDRGRARTRNLVIGVFFVTLVTQATLYLTIARSYEVFHTANRISFFSFFAWGLWIGGSYLIAGWRAKMSDSPLPNHAVPTIAWVGLIPVILNGVWPWIGGRTQTSFSMYSNLRSEEAGNHMFLKRIDLFKLQTDMVEVLTSSPDILGPSSKPEGIQQFANLGFRFLPWFEFRRLVSEHEGDFEVTYSRGGKELSLGRKDGVIFGDPTAFEPLPLLARKFLWFRRLETLDEPMCCTH